MKRLLLLIGVFLHCTLGVQAAPPPNIVFILTDDLGETDLGCYGSTFYQTPNIDKLARDGVRFTRAYSACTVCSPTRAALMTGRYPAQLHLTDWISGHNRPAAKLRIPDWSKSLTHEVRTLPQALRAAGYATCAIGKWHLSEEGPEKYGFEQAIANNGKGQPSTYFSPYKIPDFPDGPEGEFLTDRLTSEALNFMDANRSRPFFLYLAHYAVHTPLAGKAEVVAKYQGRISQDSPQKNAVYGALVESVDDSVGRIRAKLEELGLTKNTLVVFTSDNGGLLPVTSNLGMRAGKGSAYEGGVRIPAMAVLPGMTKTGAENSSPIISMDWSSTFLELAGTKDLEGAAGVNLVAALRGESLPARPLYWHYPHYHPGGATPYSAILEGGWRLVQFFEDDRVELYRLSDDPMEKRDLAASEPQKAAELRARLDGWRQSVGAQLPSPNPNYDPAPDAAGKKKGKDEAK